MRIVRPAKIERHGYCCTCRMIRTLISRTDRKAQASDFGVARPDLVRC